VVERDHESEMPSFASSKKTSSIRRCLSDQVRPVLFNLDGDLHIPPGYLSPFLDRPVNANAVWPQRMRAIQALLHLPPVGIESKVAMQRLASDGLLLLLVLNCPTCPAYEAVRGNSSCPPSPRLNSYSTATRKVRSTAPRWAMARVALNYPVGGPENIGCCARRMLLL
jgi:hypothetical protein